jgi:hypothetical protein
MIKFTCQATDVSHPKRAEQLAADKETLLKKIISLQTSSSKGF